MGSRAGHFWARKSELIDVEYSRIGEYPFAIRNALVRLREIVQWDQRRNSNMGFSEKWAETIFEYDGVAYCVGPCFFDCTAEYFAYLSSPVLEDLLVANDAEKVFYAGMMD